MGFETEYSVTCDNCGTVKKWTNTKKSFMASLFKYGNNGIHWKTKSIKYSYLDFNNKRVTKCKTGWFCPLCGCNENIIDLWEQCERKELQFIREKIQFK